MVVSIAALGTLACGPSQRGDAPTPSDDAAGLSLWQLRGRWENASGGELELGSLRGAPTLLLFFYGSCESACPALVRDLQRVEARLTAAALSRLQFVLVTIDPERDTLEKLAQYARERRLDPSRWLLLRGAPDQVRELASAAGVRYRDARTGQLSHTMRIFLLDRTGVELEHWDGLDPPVDAIVRSVTEAVERG